MCEVIHLAGTDREILSALAEILSLCSQSR